MSAEGSVSEKEARLSRIIQKLELKIRKVWDENKDLNRKLELAQLDCEIAQEQSESLKSELAELQKRTLELEELRNLSTELESTYITDIERLETECESLRTRITQSNIEAQKLETLRLELEHAQRQVKLADLELCMVKSGINAALKPFFTVDQQDWLPLFDVLHLDIGNIFDKYKRGEISMSKMAHLMEEFLDESLDKQSTYDDPRIQLELSIGSQTSRWTRVSEELGYRRRQKEAVDQQQAEAARTKAATAYQESETNVDQTSSALALRIQVLESKLEKARLVAEELESLRTWQQSAETREKQLVKELQRYKLLLDRKEEELTKLKQENLPADLLAARHKLQLTSLRRVVKQLSTTQTPCVHLDELDPPAPLPQISLFAGNPRLYKLRKLALSLELGKTPEKARELAIDLETQIMLL